LGLRRHVILPFEATRFRSTSVADCSGDWLAAFDRILGELDVGRDLETLDNDGSDMDAYGAVNRRILTVAQSLARAEEREAVAVVVWDGPTSAGDSVTAQFVQEARTRAMRVVDVPIATADTRPL
jgi:hypothetical protein